MEDLLKRAESGDANAMYELGMAYQFAKYTDKPDYEKAYYWYNRAAQLRHLEAMTSLADALSLGRGCKRDLEMAHIWYQEVYETARTKR